MSTREVPASVGQRLLWFLEHYRPDSTLLNCPVTGKLNGPLDADELAIAIDRLVLRHEALRTTLFRRGRDLIQRISDRPLSRLEVRALDDGASSADIDRRFQRELEAELAEPVDVGKAPLRATLWRLGPRRHVLCLNMHHLISDAWSCGIVIRDLLALLNADPDGDARLAPVAWQYADFSVWQHAEIGAGTWRSHQDYWTRQLRGLRTVSLTETVQPGAARHMTVTTGDIDAAAFDQLRQIARAERTTIFAVMLSIYFILLHRMTGREDLAVASLFANRSRPEVQSTVGFMANMVVLRTLLDPSDQFLDVVRKVRVTTVGALLHQGIPSQMLPLKFQDTDGRIDDLVFQMLLTPPQNSSTSARGVEFELYTPEMIGSRFALELSLVPQPDGRCRAMLFSTEEQFPSQRARELMSEYLQLAGDVAAKAGQRPAVLA